MSAKQRIQKLLTAKPERSIEHLADELTRQAARVVKQIEQMVNI